jgi:iron complex outermembrane receptor protein
MQPISNRRVRQTPWQLSICSILVVFACLLLTPHWLAAQAVAIYGVVTDPDGLPVAGASVRLYGRASGVAVVTSSRPDGAYGLSAAPGEYLLEVEAPEFGLATLNDVRLQAGGDAAHNVQLELSGQHTRIVVTASGNALPVEEVSKASDTVDGQQIRDRHEYLLAEGLRNVPGLRVQQLGGPGGQTTIKMRGLRGYDTAVLIDGLRFRDAASTQSDATGFLQDLAVVNTDRVEVLRGSGSSLYGTHAMGGVVDVHTDQGGGKAHGEISAEGGGLGFLRGLARAGGDLREGRFLYSGGVSHINVTHGVDPFDPYRNTAGHGFARYNFTPRISLSGRVFTGESFVATNESPGVEDALTPNHPASGPVPAVGLAADQLRLYEAGQPYAAGNATFVPAFNDPDNHRASSFFAGALTFAHELSAASSYRLSYQGVDTRRSHRDGPAGLSEFDPVFSNDSRFDGRIDTLRARADHQAGPQLITAGYEFEREKYVNINRDENPDPSQAVNDAGRISQTSHAVFAQDQLRLFDGRLQLSLSGRAQAFRLSTPQFEGGSTPYDGQQFESPDAALTGDVSAAYFFRSSGTKLRAHAGNAYRAPASYERLGVSFFSGFVSVWGDPGLSPERSVSFDAGIDQWLADSRVRLSATYFYTALQEVVVFDFSGIIDPATDPYGRFGGYRNTGGGLARGAEFSVSAMPTASLSLLASYTYTNSDSRTLTVPSENFSKVLGVSDHMFSFTAVQRFRRSIDVTFDFYAAGKYPLTFFSSPRLFEFDGPVKADLVASYTRSVGESKSLRFYGKLDNLFNRTYWESGFTAPGRWGIVGVGFSF